jgi:cell division protein FtsB
MSKLAPDVEQMVQRAGTTHLPGATNRQRERRYVFGGATPSGAERFVPRHNRKAVKRKFSTFSIIVVLFGIAVLSVLYINHIIVVNHLAVEVNELRVRYDRLMNAQALLQADINRKSSWERIGRIATEELGLKYPKEQPVRLTLDEEKSSRLKANQR